MKHLVLLLALVHGAGLHAKIWQVGPTRIYTSPSAVAGLVADTDTVEIDAGLYSGDVAKWFADDLLIRSVGGAYAHLAAAGNYAEGKAIWVIKGDNCTVEGIEFSGCQVPDHNGAGIRQEGKHLTLRRCYFHHNEMGILTANDGVSDYVFESCEFAFNGYGDGYSHNIYVGAVNSLTMRFCYSHDAHIGHLVKSRARFNYLYYNRLTGESGDGSYEVDLPNGGRAMLIGNIIEQSANSQNGGIISFALENQNHPEQQIILSHNTVLNKRPAGRFVQFSNATTLVKLVNNLFLGPGTLLQGTTASLDSSHNIYHNTIAAGQLSNPDLYDYWPTAQASCVDAGTDPGSFDSVSLAAEYAYLHPMSHTARWASGASPDAGAYEFLTAPYREAPDAGFVQHFFIAPNPVAGCRVQVFTERPLERNAYCRVFDTNGRLQQTMILQQGESRFEITLSDCHAGLYYLQIPGFGAGLWFAVP